MQAGYPYPNGPQPGVPVPPFIAPQASRSNSHNSPQEYTGFHPYRRPTRGQSQDSMASAAASQQPGAPFPGVAPGMNGSAPIFQPPYARPDAAGNKDIYSLNFSDKFYFVPLRSILAPIVRAVCCIYPCIYRKHEIRLVNTVDMYIPATLHERGVVVMFASDLGKLHTSRIARMYETGLESNNFAEKSFANRWGLG